MDFVEPILILIGITVFCILFVPGCGSYIGANIGQFITAFRAQIRVQEERLAADAAERNLQASPEDMPIKRNT